MSDYLVEIRFDSSHMIEGNTNIITKDKLDILQSICSRKIEYVQLSKLHVDKNTTYFWDEKDKEHDDYKILIDLYHIKDHLNIVPLKILLDNHLGLKFKVENKLKEFPEHETQQTLLSKIMSLEQKLNEFNSSTQFNTKVGVHISDLGLLNVKQVTWLEDTCTEKLQEMLNKGWRILAVCPQPDSRRPDYILGKNDQSKEDYEGIYAGRNC